MNATHKQGYTIGIWRVARMGVLLKFVFETLFTNHLNIFMMKQVFTLACALLLAITGLQAQYTLKRSDVKLANNGDIKEYINTTEKDIIIPKSFMTLGEDVPVKQIRKDAFRNKGLTSVIIPDGITIISEYAFDGNQLKSIVIPNSVINLKKYAFRNNKISSLSLSDKLKTIDVSVFESNELTSVTIPNSVTDIRKDAFKENQLTSVSLGTNVIRIGPGAFSKNPIKEIPLPPAKEGYHWTDNATKIVHFGKFYSMSLTIYTITYNVDGGATTNPATYTFESETFALKESTKGDCYIFKGWYYNPEFTGNPVTEIPKGTTGDIELWAKFEIKDGYASTTKTINVVKDAYTYSYRGDENYGTSIAVNVRRYDKRKEMRGLIDFGTLNIPYSSITNVTLNLHHYGGNAVYQGNTAFNIYQLSNDWEEERVSWNNAPAPDSEPVVTVVKHTNNRQSYAIDVTSLLKDNGDNTTSNSLMLVVANPGDENWLNFGSKENENPDVRPSLEITYYKNNNATAIDPDTKQAELTLYPNPATTHFTVESEGDTGHVSVYSLSGELVLSEALTQTTQRVDIPQLTKGVYLVKVETETSSYTQKLVVR